MTIRTVNLEAGMPTVAVAHARLLQELVRARQTGERCLKFIHGYGSTSKGGAIRRDVRSYLAETQAAGRLRAVCPGEEFSPFYEAGRRLLTLSPALRQDRDYARENDGITIVLL